MAITTIEDLFTEALSYTLDFELQSSEQCRQMSSVANDTVLKQMFVDASEECNQFRGRVLQVCEFLHKSTDSNANPSATSLTKSLLQMLTKTEQGSVRDIALVAVITHQHLNRIGFCSPLARFADLIAKPLVAEELSRIICDSKARIDGISQLAQSKLYPRMPSHLNETCAEL